MSTAQIYKHWQLIVDSNDILWLTFDKQEATINTIDRAVMQELSGIVDSIAANDNYRGVIINSGKKIGFIAGADISQFNKFASEDEAVRLLKQGQLIFDKLEALKIPTVAMIEGFCLGGGLELALACRYRIAENSAHTRLGLPEVKLGIHPGWGGSVRLPRLIGAPAAMQMMLSGSTVSAKVAVKQGLVDVAIPKRHLKKAAIAYVMQPVKKRNYFLAGLTNQAIFRPLIAKYLKRQLQVKINSSHYPAPFQLINNWEKLGVDSTKAFEREAISCGKLFFTKTCQNLVRVFFLQERLKSFGKDCQFSPTSIHVIGAGTMGGDIAIWCAMQGFTVTLQDKEPNCLAPVMKRAYRLYKEKLKEANLIQSAMDRLIPDVAGHGIAKADIIIEAVFEDLTTKQTIFKNLEEHAKPDAILATNTSSIPLNEIGTVLKNPARLVGIHFFNPVAKMQLVEIVSSDQTDPSIAEKAMSFVRQIDRLPLPVKSAPGFLVNRVLMPYLLESLIMLEEGVSATAIDEAMTKFGMPMGPVTLADTVGLDVCLAVAKHLGKYIQTIIPDRLVQLVENGKLGKKTGRGFYQYNKDGKLIKPDFVAVGSALEQKIATRLLQCLINEANNCLKEEIVKDADLIDAGMIFGTGFAPFRGGPLHYAAQTQDVTSDIAVPPL